MWPRNMQMPQLFPYIWLKVLLSAIHWPTSDPQNISINAYDSYFYIQCSFVKIAIPRNDKLLNVMAYKWSNQEKIIDHVNVLLYTLYVSGSACEFEFF